MSANANPKPFSFRQEDGFLLLGVLFMVLLILIALAVAAPKMAESIRRDKEIETVHRGMQYARAIQVYFNKYGRYPSTIDQLMKTDNQRFLRKRYLDPMTGKDDWRIIHYGEATPQNIGLFGQTVQQNGITPTGASTTTGPAHPLHHLLVGLLHLSVHQGLRRAVEARRWALRDRGLAAAAHRLARGRRLRLLAVAGRLVKGSTSPIGGTDSTTGSSLDHRVGSEEQARPALGARTI